MLKENLKVAIKNSGLYVKEISAKSGVNKRTIDKWIGKNETEPKVMDLYKVCKTLEVTIEWVIAGEIGSEYVRKMVKNDPKTIKFPERIRSIVESLVLLDDNELIGIQANAEALVKIKKKKSPR